MENIKDLGESLLKDDWFVNGQTYNLNDLGWTFKLNQRKSSLGVCVPLEKSISISSYFIKENLENIHMWDDTIRHEIAHAIDYEINGLSDHSNRWKGIAVQVGCDPVRTVDRNKIKMPNGKYTLRCKVCGTEQIRHRKLTVGSACGKCCKKHNGGVYHEKYILDMVVNF